jgi:TonB family protein
MRLLFAAMAVAAAGASAALAQDDDWRPDFIKTSTEAQMLAVFPQQARDEGVSGKVLLECAAGAKGELTNCTVLKEDPAGQGFGEAALKLSVHGQVKTTDRKGVSIVGRPFKLTMRFVAPGDANPKWMTRPTGDMLASVYPRAALQKGVDGRAVINCGVTVEGFLSTCQIVSEEPEGLGFGAAALQLAPQFRLTPKIDNGKPVASRVDIPVNWSGLQDLRLTMGKRMRAIVDPPWTEVPTAQEVRAAWPEKQTVKAGSATIRCRLTAGGKLKDCETLTETPKRAGFGWAAENLAKRFTMRMTPQLAAEIADFAVDIPFRFRNPAEPDTRGVTRPKWIESLSPESVALVFPAAARAANLSEGKGTINCLVTLGGKLADCRPVSEEPAGLGFADAAVLAAGYMVMNPWSVDGDPLDGLRVTLPIRLQLVDGPSGAPAQPAP